MSDHIQTLSDDARRRLEHSFRQLEVLLLQERLAILMGCGRSAIGPGRTGYAKPPPPRSAS
jgi:hypothetical protein